MSGHRAHQRHDSVNTTCCSSNQLQASKASKYAQIMWPCKGAHESSKSHSHHDQTNLLSSRTRPWCPEWDWELFLDQCMDRSRHSCSFIAEVHCKTAIYQTILWIGKGVASLNMIASLTVCCKLLAKLSSWRCCHVATLQIAVLPLALCQWYRKSTAQTRNLSYAAFTFVWTAPKRSKATAWASPRILAHSISCMQIMSQHCFCSILSIYLHDNRVYKWACSSDLSAMCSCITM